ncbi:serpin A3-7-like [Haemaphysalis longicornis]
MDNAPPAITLLGCHMFRNLFAQCPNDNVLVSPHSAMIVVSLLMAGAQRTTEREMAEALKVKLPQFHTAMRRILVFAPFGSPPPEEEDTVFRMANRILVNSSLSVSDSFRKIGQRVYRTLVTPANFARRAAEERRLLNTWAESITGIKNMIPPDCPLDADTRIVLLGAAALDTLWKFPFPKVPMRRPFGSWPSVPTMGVTATLGYACIEDLGVRALNVPFSCDAYTATIMLPTGKLEDLCANLTPEVLTRVFDAVKERQKVRLELPRFSATFEAELTDVLQKLGIREVFTDGANLRTVTTTTPVSLTWVLHKVQLGVHEGITPTIPLPATSAASTSGATGGSSSAPGGSSSTPGGASSAPVGASSAPGGSVSSVASSGSATAADKSAAEGSSAAEGEASTAAPADVVVEFLVNKPFVLCVRKNDILVLLASIQRVHVP